ncbi:MAG TPA: isoprenoid biosynthesis glyoxalase ElbB [Abditibacteriaceae bacterium]|jgi:enhancing lycopene biosynthesis protein 2
MPKVGVLLSGCGVQDGSEVYEAVLTILALERGGATVQALAPDIEQPQIVNHYTGQETRLEARNVLTESARIVRGKITSTSSVSAHDLDALIIVGGYGVLKNLSGYAVQSEAGSVNPDVERLIQEMNGLGKPIGAMCAGVTLVAMALRAKGPTLTIGTDGSAAAGVVRLGARHIITQVDEIHIDEANSIVSTAAFYAAHTVSEAEPGITKLVNHVLAMVRQLGVDHGDQPTTTSTYSTLDAGLNTGNASV